MREFSAFHLFVLLVAVMLTGGCRHREHQFTTDVLNSYTPVKNQRGTETCWAYAMLAAIETEHIMRGDSVHLSVAYVVQKARQDSLMPSSMRAVGMTLINMIGRYGVVPYGAMPDDDSSPMGTIGGALPLPRFAFMEGCRYTPLEFAHSVCAPGEYVGVGTTDSYPYYEEYVFDVPDNWEHNRLLNLPPDSLLRLTERAVREGHGVCWEGDTSERGFSFKDGVAQAPFSITPAADNHCMAIVGLAHDEEQRPYFIMKNSWGVNNPYGGLMYMSFDYFIMKTLAVFLVRDALTPTT